MSGEPQITLIGNLGKDPETRTTPNGNLVSNFSVAVTPRRKNGDKWEDGATIWFRVTQWGDSGAHNATQLQKGDKVIVTGLFSMFEYEKDGITHTGPEVNAEVIATILKPASKPTTTDNGSPW